MPGVTHGPEEPSASSGTRKTAAVFTAEGPGGGWAGVLAGTGQQGRVLARRSGCGGLS